MSEAANQENSLAGQRERAQSDQGAHERRDDLGGLSGMLRLDLMAQQSVVDLAVVEAGQQAGESTRYFR